MSNVKLVSKCGLLFLILALAIGYVGTANAEVRYFDGFGDGDLDNNGEVLGRTDVDIDRNFLLDPVNGLGSTYTPGAFPGTSVTEISSVLDPADQGIRWTFARGWSSLASPPRPPEFDPKANIKIMDDSVGMMPDSTHATHPVSSLDTGYAMGFDSKGRGSSVTGFFGSGAGSTADPWQFENVALGPMVGDQVKVSFDFRTWLSAPPSNAETPPRVASLRFGLFQDTDNQLGMENPFAGQPNTTTGIPTAANWGVEGGHFRGDLGTVGATEDRGWFTSIDLGKTDYVPGLNDPAAADFNGLGARINEETNTVASGGKILEGSDNDFVAKTDTTTPTFTALDVTKSYNLALTLERATDLTPGDTIKAIFTVRELVSGMTWTMEDTEPLFRDDMGVMVPDGISSDSWDYFAIRNTTPLASDGDDFDFLLDNFKLELFGSNATGGPDFNSDGLIDCTDVNSLVVEIVAGTNGAGFDLNSDGFVNQQDLTEWLAQAGAANLPSGNSYLVGDANLDSVVDGQDFIVWNTNKFTSTAAFCSGDFNADGVVDGQDFIQWNTNKFQSADGNSAVPEPVASCFWLMIAVGCFLRRGK